MRDSATPAPRPRPTAAPPDELAPGATRTLMVKVAKGTKRLADRKGHLKVLVVASTGPSGEIAQSSRRLTLALGRALSPA